MTRISFVALAMVLGLAVGDRADSQDKPPIKEVVISDAQEAKFYMENGIIATGKLLSLNGKRVNCVVRGRKYNYTSDLFKAVEIKGGVMVYLPRQNAFVRLEPVTVLNNSGERVTFTLNAAYNFLGHEVVLIDDRMKTDLESGLEKFGELFGGSRGGAPKQAPIVEWAIEPGKTLELKYGDLPIHTNRLRFTLKNGHGVTKHVRENDRLGSHFVLTIEKADTHTPVLVKLGEWKLDQDVTYTTVHGRDPARATTIPIESFDKKRIVRYETYYYPSRDYEYTKRENAGIATASAEIENPTSKPLTVSITLEFSFAHLLLSKTQVSSQFEVAAASKGMIRMEVDTKGFFDNRKVTGVKVVDVITMPK